MKVKDCYKKITTKATLAYENDSIESVFDKVLEDKKSRSVYVLDEKEELSGIIPVVEVMHFLAPQFIGEEFEGVRDLFARKAKDLMREPVHVSPIEELEKALKLMLEHKLEELPVVEEGKIIGELNCLEVIEALKH